MNGLHQPYRGDSFGSGQQDKSIPDKREYSPSSQVIKLVERVQEMGSVNLSEATEQERRDLLVWFEKEFDNIDKGEQVQFLEQFMMMGDVEDDESFKFARKMSEDSRKEIALFMGDVLKSPNYRKTFYICFQELNNYGTYSDVERIESYYTNVEPENAILVAPFVDLSRVKIHVPKESSGGVQQKKQIKDDGEHTKRGKGRRDFPRHESKTLPATKGESLKVKTEKKDFLDEYFSTYDTVSQLFESVLDYYEFISNNDYSQHHTVQSAKDKARSLILFYLTSMKALIVAKYVKRLILLDLITEQEIKDLTDKVTDFVSLSVFKTSEEVQWEKKAVARYVELNNLGSAFGFFSNDAGESFAQKMQDNEDIEKIRASEAFVELVEAQRNSDLDLPAVLMKAENESYIPIFAHIERLDLSADEIVELINRVSAYQSTPFMLNGLGDFDALLKYADSFEKKDKDKVLRAVERNVLMILNEGEEHYFSKFFVQKIESFLPRFSNETQKKIVKTISSSDVSWTFNIEYAVENNIITMNELINRMVKTKTWFLNNHYNRIRSKIIELTNKGVNLQYTVQDLDKAVVKAIYENPCDVFSKEFKGVVNNYFRSREDILTFIRSNIENASADFLIQILKSEYKKDFLTEVKVAISTRQDVFIGFLDNGFKDVADQFSADEFLELIENNYKLINFDGLYREFAIQFILTSEQTINRFLKVLKKVNNPVLMVGFINKAKEMMAAYLRNKKELAKTEGKLKQNQMILYFENALREAILEECENTPGFVFTNGLIKVVGQETGKYIKRDAERFLVTNVHVLIPLEEYGNKLDENALEIISLAIGEEKYQQYLDQYLRTLVFENVGYSGRKFKSSSFPIRLLNKIYGIDPTREFEEKNELEKDYYEVYIEAIKSRPFFSMFKDELESIAKKQKEIFGEQKDPTQIIENPEFKKLVDLVLVLSASRFAVKHKSLLEKAKQQGRESLINLFYSLSNYSIDTDISDSLLNEEDLEKTEEVLSEIFRGFVSRLLEVEKLKQFEKAQISPDLLNAFLIYFRERCKKYPTLKEAFHEFLAYHLNGTYESQRAWLSDKEPEESEKQKKLDVLKERQLVPSNIILDQYEVWIDDMSVDFEQSLKYKIEDVRLGISEVLSQAIGDAHIDEEALRRSIFEIEERYQQILLPIKEWMFRRRQLNKKFSEARIKQKQGLPFEAPSEEERQENEDLKQKVAEYKENFVDELKRIEALRYLHRLKNISSEELEQGKLKVDAQYIKFNNVLDLIKEAFAHEYPEFVSDISRLQKTLFESREKVFGGSRVSKLKLVVTDKVDFKTHFFIGEDPVPSCQSYQGKMGDYNKSMFSYVTDTNVRFIQIYNEQGKIVSRAALRLLEDQNGNPQLFLERVYSINAHTKIDEAIVQFAKDKASQMGIGVFSREVQGETVSDNDELSVESLHSKASRSPFVYTDAGGGTSPNGIYQIKVSSQL